jgi:hypothetical protein
MNTNNGEKAPKKSGRKNKSNIPEVHDTGWVCPDLEEIGVFFEERSDGSGVFLHPSEKGYARANEKNFRRWLRENGHIDGGKKGFFGEVSG